MQVDTGYRLALLVDDHTAQKWLFAHDQRDRPPRNWVFAAVLHPLPTSGEHPAMQDLAGMDSFTILGATGATGEQLARDLHARGAKLRLLARNEAKLNKLAGELDAEPTVLVSVAPTSVCDVLLASCVNGPTSGIARCIGSLLLKPAKRTTAEEWHEVIQTNLSSAFGVTMVAGDCMKNGGSVVFCSSVAATLGLANHEAIAAAKAGLIGLARAASNSSLPPIASNTRPRASAS